MKTILAFLVLAAAAAAQPQYFISTTDSSGYTIQNVFVDFATLDQPQAVGRIALNSAICRGDSLLVRPSPVTTIQVTFRAAQADSILSPAVTGSVSLAQALTQRIVEWSMRDSHVPLPDTVTLKKLTGGTVSVVAGYRQPP